MMKWPCWLAVAIGLGAMTTTAAMPTTIFVVRHAEKASGPGDQPLSEEGRARAGLLARMLGNAGVRNIFTSPLMRAKETAAPLADRLGIRPQVVEAKDLEALVAELAKLPTEAVTLVVGHSNTVPPLIEKLTGTAPTSIAEHEHDRLFVVTTGSPASTRWFELQFGSASAKK